MVQIAFRMDDDFAGMDEDPAAEISRLEAQIERLAEVAESCRKVILAAKVAIGLGALVLLVSLTGLINADEVVAFAAIAASTALPPRFKISTPTSVAAGTLVQTIPCVAKTSDRVAKFLPVMRSICAINGKAGPTVSSANMSG